jgi:SAM-dependent methyltransferase
VFRNSLRIAMVRIVRNHLRNKSREVHMNVSGRNEFVVDWVRNVLGEGDTVLDAGCGYGWVAWHVQQFAPRTKFICIEPDTKTLEIAKSLVDNREVFFCTNWDEVQGSGLGGADVAVSIEVLEHVPRGGETEYLTRFAQSLKPGARALVTTPARTLRSTILDPAFWLARHRHYSRDSLMRFLSESGLRVVAMSKRGGLAELVSIWDLYVSKWVFRREPLLEKLYRQALRNEWRASSGGWMGWWIELER